MIALFSLWGRTDVDTLIEAIMLACFALLRQGPEQKMMAIRLRNAVAIADDGRTGEVRFLGEIDNTEAATAKLVKKLAAKYQRVTFCYEAGRADRVWAVSTDQGSRSRVHRCGPSLILKRPGDKVKTNRRDAVSLAKLLRAGELTAVVREVSPGRGLP
jgi:hypothetical protein